MTSTTIIGSLNTATSPGNIISTDALPIQRSGLTFQSYVNSATLNIVSAIDYGVVGNGSTDNSTTMANTIAASPYGTCVLPVGTYLMNGVETNTTSITGSGFNTILRANSTTEILNLGWTDSGAEWTKRTISNLTIDGNSQTSNGLNYYSSSSPSLSGRWFLNTLTFQNCIVGINKPTGDIGNYYLACDFNNNNFGYYAQSASGMHAGNDVFESCQFSDNSLAALYFNSNITGTGGTAIRDTVIEYNPGFGIFVENWSTSFSPLIMDNVWFEGNATSGSVTINSVSYSPVALYLANCALAVLNNSVVPSVQLVSSSLTIDACLMDAGSNTSWNIDSNSFCSATNANIYGGAHPITIKSIGNIIQASQNATFLANPRSVSNATIPNTYYSNTYNTVNSITFSNFPNAGINMPRISDGLIFDSCLQVTVPANNTWLFDSDQITVSAANWVVISFDIKIISGPVNDLEIDIWGGIHLLNPNTVNILNSVPTGQWTTISTVGYTFGGGTVYVFGAKNSSGSTPVVLNLSALQIIEFSTLPEAINYYNAGLYTTPLVYPKLIYGTTPPVVGSWISGDMMVNTSPSVGSPESWNCISSGSPGTWQSVILPGSGTFTPILTANTPGDLNIVYSNQLGYYRQSGGIVFATLRINTTTFTYTTASGNLLINGLPITSASTTDTTTGSMIFSGITKAGYTQFGPQLGNSSTQLQIVACSSGASASNVAVTDIPSGTNVALYITMVYSI